MSSQQAALSQEALARFDQTTEPWTPARRRQGSLSTLRSVQSQPRDRPAPPRPPPPPLRALATPLDPASLRRNSVSNPNTPFLLRRESASLGKRFSFGGWLQGGGRSSFSGLALQPYPAAQAEVRLENTYRTGPDRGARFRAADVQKLLQATLDGHLAGARYSPESGGHLGQVLADALRGKVKEVSPPRYKLVCQVVIGQGGSQGVRVASRCLWDPQLDDCAVATFQSGSLFALALVHGVYCE